MNKIREGLIPTVLGTAVATTGALMSRNSNKDEEKVAWGIIGFGLAHIVLGAIDMVQHRDE